ncbi:MAG: hypothetical protein DRP67_02305 [Candidatus Omnitrophota bacterium]|nr:MAG: hypothetical protein DRP67_02305 [Candidatus Omnitrophota bacterium]
MEKLEEIRNKFIEMIGNLGESLGLNRTTCQIYALLYISQSPLSLTQIGKTLGISKGNVSINLRKLEEWNAIKKVWRKGYARSLYKANENIEEIIFQKLKTGIEKRVSLLEESIKNIQKQLKKKNKDEELKYIRGKISEIEKLTKKILAITKNLKYLKKNL